jgi:hypothetical protein
MIYEQTPIRLQVTLAGTPPVLPVDQSTGNAPQFWRASSVVFAIGIFDAFGNPVDLSNLAQLQLSLFQSASALVPLVTKTIAGADLYPLITALGWSNGTQANANFVFLPADTDQGLGGLDSASFWLVLNGTTNAGALVLYSAGAVTINNASNALPIAQNLTPSYNASGNSAGNQTVQPSSNIHLEDLTITGAARTTNVIISGVGMIKGARVSLLVHLPATADIVLSFRDSTLGGTELFNLNTNAGVNRAILHCCFNGSAYIPIEAVYPAY